MYIVLHILPCLFSDAILVSSEKELLKYYYPDYMGFSYTSINHTPESRLSSILNVWLGCEYATAYFGIICLMIVFICFVVAWWVSKGVVTSFWFLMLIVLGRIQYSLELH